MNRLFLPLVLLMLTAACKSNQRADRVDQVLRVPITAMPDLELKRGNEINANKVVDNVFEHLVGLDESLSPVPEIARKWIIRNHSSEVEFEIDPTKHFHNGSPVTSEDVLNTFLEAYRNENEVLSQFKSLEGCKLSSSCDGFRVIDSSRFIIRLKNKNFALLMKKLASAKAVIVKKIGDKYIGTGPYKLSEINADGIILDRADDRANFDKIHLVRIGAEDSLQKFLKREVDVLSDVESSVNQDSIPAHTAYTKKIAGTYSLVFDQKQSIFKNRENRRAVALAIDTHDFHRHEKSENIPAGGLVPKGYLGFSEKRHALDRVKARSLILGNTTLSQRTVKLGVRNKFKGNRAIEEYLTSAFRDISLNLQIVFLPFDQVLKDFREGKLDMVLKGDAPINFDPSTAFDAYVGKQMQKFSGYNGHQLADLMSAYEDALDDSQKIKLLSKMEAVFHEDVPAVPLFYAVATTWYRPGLSVRNAGSVSVRFWNFSYQDVYQGRLVRNEQQTKGERKNGKSNSPKERGV